METISQIIGFIASFILFRFAFKYFAKEKYPTGLYIATVGAFILLCSFPWFQGFAKTWIISNVNSKLEALGQQVNIVQASTAEMHGQLANHQIQIDKHQKELDDVQVKIRNAQSDIANQQTNITRQYQQISTVQSDLASAQTNLDMQEKKISDVEYLVDNLFSKMTVDRFSSDDTNQVVYRKKDNGTCNLAVKLKFFPIQGSIQVIIGGGRIIPQITYYDNFTYKNVIFFSLSNYDINNTSFTVQYVKDTRETNLVNKVEFISDKDLFIDGAFVHINTF
jgi:hypothetical protein